MRRSWCAGTLFYNTLWMEGHDEMGSLRQKTRRHLQMCRSMSLHENTRRAIEGADKLAMGHGDRGLLHPQLPEGL